MMCGAFGYRLPPAGWKPEGWTPPAGAKAMITTGHVNLKDAHKTMQFWLLWAVLCLNVSAGIGIIGAAAPMLQETFGGRLFGDPSVGFADFTDDQKNKAALVGAAFVGLFSLFNIAGRIFWASLSDRIGRKVTYFIFFSLGFACYAAAPTLATLGALALFAAAFCLIASMYGGGFATIPAYLADIFGTQFVGAIHGRLLTAWSTAGIVGPVIVNYMHDARKAAGVPPDQIYHPIFYVLAGLLVGGFVANLLIRPLNKKWFMKPEEVEALQTKTARERAMHTVEIRAPEETRPGIRLLQPIGMALIAVADRVVDPFLYQGRRHRRRLGVPYLHREPLPERNRSGRACRQFRLSALPHVDRARALAGRDRAEPTAARDRAARLGGSRHSAPMGHLDHRGKGARPVRIGRKSTVSRSQRLPLGLDNGLFAPVFLSEFLNVAFSGRSWPRHAALIPIPHYLPC